MIANAIKTIIGTAFRVPTLCVILLAMYSYANDDAVSTSVFTLTYVILGFKVFYLLLHAANYAGILVIAREQNNPLSKNKVRLDERDHWLFWILPHQTWGNVKFSLLSTFFLGLILAESGEMPLALMNLLTSITLVASGQMLIKKTLELTYRKEGVL